MSPQIERKTCQAPDGVTIVYSVAGSGDTGLVFVHGGMADRTFFDVQLNAFADRYRVIALDLAGHGESGADRTTWGMPQFGADVKAVVDAEKLDRVVLFGNSLGGPAVIEAALIMPGRVAGVVGIDTFQDLGHPETPEFQRAFDESVRQRAEAFRADYPAALASMVKMLFHPDADQRVVADAERRMIGTSPAVAYSMMSSFAGYNTNASARRLTVPLRSVNGDLYATNLQAARAVKPDFDAIVMKHMGHYPMLERPEEFNAHVATVAEALLGGGK